MYKVRYWSYNKLKSKIFQTLSEATAFSVYEAPFQSIHSIDLIKD